MAKWYEEAIFYHIYPLGLLGRAQDPYGRGSNASAPGAWMSGCRI